MRIHRCAIACGLVLALLAAWPCARAGTLQVRVAHAGAGVPDAVVSLHSAGAAAASSPGRASIDQRDTQFAPRVSVVEAGTAIEFPNSDAVRHQVYSFSPAKRFDLPLYSGRAAEPVVFDVPGVVELGCNIHDWMLAYVVVVDTPYHALTGAGGRASLQAPAGRYRLQVWHPDLPPGSPPHVEDVEVADGAGSVAVSLALVARAAPPPPSDDRLRALQDRFRKLKGGK